MFLNQCARFLSFLKWVGNGFGGCGDVAVYGVAFMEKRTRVTRGCFFSFFFFVALPGLKLLLMVIMMLLLYFKY